MTRQKILSSPVYWFDKAQNELFRQFHYYMERENINQTQLAERLGITKGRISQILTGNSNFRMSSLMELGLSIGVIPKINYVTIIDEVSADELKRTEKLKKLSEKETKIPAIAWPSNPTQLKIGTTTDGEGMSYTPILMREETQPYKKLEVYKSVYGKELTVSI